MSLDNQLFAEIITLLNSGFTSISSLVPTAPDVIQSYQPVQQGALSGPTLYLYKIDDELIGWPDRNSQWQTSPAQMDYTETQQYATRFQASCWVTQDPSNTSSLTASDYANYARYIMQSAATITALEALGWGILDVSQVRNPAFTDDRDRFEFAPSFDFTITHKQIIELTTPIISKTIVQLLDV